VAHHGVVARDEEFTVLLLELFEDGDMPVDLLLVWGHVGIIADTTDANSPPASADARIRR
jgi:hypothetical protein